MLRLVPYTGNHSREWNQFVAQSRTPHFLFDRNYMEYHSDRFTDCSYLAYDDLKLVALFPASRSDDIVASHGGLTFGGFLTDKSVRTVTMLGLFDELLNQLIQDGVKSLVYKPIPHFYQSYPSDEDLYALFRTDATLVRRDVSTTILVSHRFTASKGRKSTLKKAVSMGFVVQESKNFANFMELE
ncbi:MAG: GNAT family N-acetyltransferase, partial [Planctomycetes bacterium]|nr:GNAT family N-acetyltransferase [Planctomycetota bacterium]